MDCTELMMLHLSIFDFSQFMNVCKIVEITFFPKPPLFQRNRSTLLLRIKCLQYEVLSPFLQPPEFRQSQIDKMTQTDVFNSKEAYYPNILSKKLCPFIN
nr:MAG TPA: hypothetical protein [Caudoviricetes sp.]